MIKTNPCGCGGVSSHRPEFGGAGINSACHGFTGGVEAHQGHAVPHPRIVVIYWDQIFTNNPATVTTMNQFVTDLAAGGYWKGLGQYGVGSASVAAPIVINMTKYPTPNSQNPNQPFSESQMQAQLVQWLDQGAVTPKPAGNEEDLVYLIMAPSDTKLTLNGQTGFCGYHQSTKYNASTSRDNLVWGTVQGYTVSSNGQTLVNSISFCISHELSEAFSNPDGQGYFNDSNGCEIGDMCEAPAGGACCTTVPYKVSGRTWNVEQYWSNLDGRCISGASPLIAAARSSLACFGVHGTDSRVYYLDSNRRVNELAWQGGRWAHNTLTTGVDGAPASGSALACFGVNGTDSRVYYLDSNQHVMELAWIGGWRPPLDVTAQTGAPAAVAGSALACFGVNGSASRVYYFDSNHRVNELAWINGWQHPSDILNAQKGARPALNGSGLACLGVNGADSRVYYLDSNQHVNELAWSNGWSSPTDVTSQTKASAAAGSSALACFGVNGSASRVYYVDSGHRVNELAWINGWQHPGDILVAQTNALPAVNGSALACFGVNGADSRVYYVDAKQHVNELAWSNGWGSPFDVIGKVGGASAESGSALTCFGVAGSASRIYYEDPSNYVEELAWNNGWANNVL